MIRQNVLMDLRRDVGASHETQQNKGTSDNPGIVHRPRGGSESLESRWEAANDPTRSETALNSESNEAHDRNKRTINTNAMRPYEFEEETAFAHTQLQTGDGVPDWASKEFAEQTLEKGPMKDSLPRVSDPADATYESAASKNPYLSTMGPGASSMAATRTKEAYDKTFNWGEGLATGISKRTGTKPDAIRKLERSLGSRSFRNSKLKAYDPESESVDSAEKRVIKARRAFKDNKEQYAQRYKRPEEPLSMRHRPLQGPERKPSMWQKLKDRFK